jgi:hypothetical protein
MTEIGLSRQEKMVIQLGTKTIKGYLECPECTSIEDLFANMRTNSSETLRIRLLESNAVEEVSVRDVKAIFFVKSFEGDPNHRDLFFSTRAPIFQGVWMRFQFRDGEVMEGIAHNSIRYLVDPGFFVLPTDPGSNNKLVYVSKSWLTDHRIIGMRTLEGNDYADLRRRCSIRAEDPLVLSR